MPIGFWAISRDEVREFINYFLVDYHKEAHYLTTGELNKAIKGLKEKLDEVYEEFIIDFVIALH